MPIAQQRVDLRCAEEGESAEIFGCGRVQIERMIEKRFDFIERSIAAKGQNIGFFAFIVEHRKIFVDKIVPRELRTTGIEHLRAQAERQPAQHEQ